MAFYNDIVNQDITLMQALIEKINADHKATEEDETKAWEIFRKYYIDPDGYMLSESGLRSRAGIGCTVDGLLSVNRIHNHEGFNENFIKTFVIGRSIPIIFFPSERGGINTSRATAFGDRIDHTLFDLKQFFANSKNPKDCELASAYERVKTAKWLNSFSDFQELVQWMGIDGIFVNDAGEVFDLEKSDGSTLTAYADSYSKDWTPEYYQNVLAKSKEFRQRQLGDIMDVIDEL